jgi:hypothetical protein
MVLQIKSLAVSKTFTPNPEIKLSRRDTYLRYNETAFEVLLARSVPNHLKYVCHAYE